MQLIKITDKYAIFRDGDRFVAKPLNPMARTILKWFYKSIGANDD